MISLFHKMELSLLDHYLLLRYSLGNRLIRP